MAEHEIAHHTGKCTLIAGKGPRLVGAKSRFLESFFVQWLVRIGHLRPFIYQGVIHLHNELAEPFHNVPELLVSSFRWESVSQSAPGIGEVAQENTFGAGDSVLRYHVRESHGLFHHLAHHRLGRQRKLTHPRVTLGIGVECALQLVGKRHRPCDVFDDVHTFGVIDAFGLERGDFLTASLFLLRDEQWARVFQN